MIAPTEGPALKSLGRVSNFPERYGCDAIWLAKGRWCGVQRKELSDLIASIHDGRLSKEVAQGKRLGLACLVVEGRPVWTMDGELVGRGFGGAFTKKQYLGLLWSVRAKGWWVEHTEGVGETVDLVQSLATWTQKDRHSSLSNRPGASGIWGRPSDRDFSCHLLMGLPGVGSELAGRMVDHFGGVPWRWDVGMDDLVAVEGIGKKKAATMYRALRGIKAPT